MRNVVIVDACRTAVGSFGGSLRPLKADALARAVMIAALERTGLEPGQVDEIFLGHCRSPPIVPTPPVCRPSGRHTGDGARQHGDVCMRLRYAGSKLRLQRHTHRTGSGSVGRRHRKHVQCYFLSVRRSLGSGYGNHSAEGLSHGGPILFPAPGHLWQVQHGYYGRKYCR